MQQRYCFLYKYTNSPPSSIHKRVIALSYRLFSVTRLPESHLANSKRNRTFAEIITKIVVPVTYIRASIMKKTHIFSVLLITFLFAGCANQKNAVTEQPIHPTPTVAEVRLAKQYDLVVGDTFQLFYSGVIKSFYALDPNLLGLNIRCEKGKQYLRYWEYQPTAEEVGEYELTIDLRNFDGSVMATGTTKIVVHAVPTYAQKKRYYTLGFGDSLTSTGAWFAEGMRRLTGTDTLKATGPASLQVENLEFVSYGKKQNTVNTYPVRYEGYGGWKWVSFLTTDMPSSTTNGIVVSFAAAHNYDINTVQKSEWMDNYGRKWELEDFPSANQIKFNRGAGNKLAQSKTELPETLTCEFLNLTITPAESAWESGNPFYDEKLDEINFKTHATECGAPTCDIAAVLLSWNRGGAGGRSGMEYQAYIDAHMKHATTLIRKFHQDFPNAKLICMGIPLNSLTGGNGANYGAKGRYSDMWGTAFYCFDYNKALEELVTNEEFGKFCYYCDTKAQFDTEYMMPYAMVPVNTRSKVTEMRGNNALHPLPAGYLQIGDAYYRALVRVLNEVK